MDNAMLIGANNHSKCYLRGDKSNRHGLITGATGTGKTITLQNRAEIKALYSFQRLQQASLHPLPLPGLTDCGGGSALAVL